MSRRLVGMLTGILGRADNSQWLPVRVSPNGELYAALVETAPIAERVAASAPVDDSPTEVVEGRSSQRFYLSTVLVQNSSSDTGTWVNVYGEGSDSVICSVYAGTEGGGACLQFPAPVPLEEGQTLVAECETSGASVRVSVTGFFL